MGKEEEEDLIYSSTRAEILSELLTIQIDADADK